MDLRSDTIQDLIIRYFEGELDLKEQQQFQEYLKDPAFQKAVKEHQEILIAVSAEGEDFDQALLGGLDLDVNDPQLKTSLQEQEKRVLGKAYGNDAESTKIVTSKRFGMRRLLAVAASVLVLLVAGSIWFANANYSRTSIAANQYELPMPNSEMGVVEKESPFKKGRVAFFNKQYKESIRLLEGIPSDSEKFTEAQYLLAHAHFNQKSYEKAAGLFTNVKSNLDQLPMIYREINQINWYLILSKLGAGHDETETRALLKVLKENPAYKPKAEALEKALDSGWHHLVF